MSDPGVAAKASSSCSAVHPAPGFFPASVRPTWVSGQIRKRRALAAGDGISPKTSCGAGRKRTRTSVAVTGRHFPARISNGTPAQRHESAASRSAT